MTTLFDRAVAVTGLLYAAMHRRAPWAPWAVVGGLVILSLIPVLIVGSTRQPTDISFADLEAQRIPALTSWFRLEGELREVSADGLHVYTLHDTQDDARAVTVVAGSPLATGHTQVTGRISPESSVAGTFQTIQADVPTEPPRRDPWLLYSIPAILAILVVQGARAGYPVVRRDPPHRSRSRARAVPLGPNERLSARWGGWIGNERVGLGELRRCSLAVAGDRDVCRLTIRDPQSVRTVPVRRAASNTRVRLCRTDGCQPGLEVHAQAADVVLVFDDPADRERLAASIG